MLHFNELYITEDGKHLVIDVEVDNLVEYESCFIKNIYISTEKDCTFENPVLAWEADWLVGDFNQDGMLDSRDIELWKELHKIMDVPRSHIKQDEEGNYYFTSIGQDDEVLRNPVSKTAVKIYDQIAANYVDPVLGNDTSPNDVHYKLIAFIVDNIKSDDSYYQVFGHRKNKDKPYDISGDGEYGLADISAFNSYMDSLKLDDAGSYIFSEFDIRRHVRLCLDNTDECIVQLFGDAKANLAEHMFFVKVEAQCGASIANLACGWDDNKLYGIAYDAYPLYKNFINLAEGFTEDCDSSNAPMIDYILRYYALDFAAKCGDWCRAAEYWSSFSDNNVAGNTVNIRGCGCHGPY